MSGVGAHHSPRMGTDVWLTPPHILEALGPFDLDPCAPEERPWPMAAEHYTPADNGLRQPWHGFVWCNPPYGRYVGDWLSRLADHGSGIALTFARTETRWFHRDVWERADAALFLKGLLNFYDGTGKPGAINAGGPSVLIAYGALARKRLADCDIPGRLVRLDLAKA